MKLSPLFATLVATATLLATPVSAQEAAWQSSYQLEAAGKYVEALAAVDPVPPNGPDAELKLLRRGWLYYLPGKFDESIREYRLAIDRNGKSIDARLGLTLPLLAAKRWREADAMARSVLELAPNNYTAMARLAAAQENLQDWQGLVKTASAMTASYTTDPTAYVYLARANAALGQRNEAVTAYAAVLSRFPGHLEAKAYLAKK